MENNPSFRFLNNSSSIPAMIPMLLFSAAAAAMVFFAGRGDKARDPRLTVLALGLLAVFPLLGFLPKLAVLPAGPSNADVTGFPWRNVFLAVWATGFLVGVVRLAIAAAGISAWRNHSVVVDCREGVEIRKLAGLKGPVAAGVIRPVIFVPEGWSVWSAEIRRLVLDHEMAHHHRRDPLWRWIGEIACVVNACNPLVIWMTRRLTVQCEYACDALVLEKGVAVCVYANLLCDFAEVRPPSGPLLAMAASSTLESRVRRMLNPRQPGGAAGLVALAVLTLTIAVSLAVIGAGKVLPVPVSQNEVRMRWSADPFPGETAVSETPGR